VTIVDNGLGHDPIPTDGSSIEDHLNSVKSRASRLLIAVQGLLPGLPDPADLREFPGFVRSPSRGSGIPTILAPDDADRDFLRMHPTSAGQFVLATGQSAHFITARPRLGCRAHDWAFCQQSGEQVGNQAVVVRSSDPASFFFSSELHHCAHRVLHARRAERCKVRAFENYLCCQTCTYQPICWNGAGDLPCGVGAMAEAAVVVDAGSSAPQ
jgi:hypothetical protein